MVTVSKPSLTRVCCEHQTCPSNCARSSASRRTKPSTCLRRKLFLQDATVRCTVLGLSSFVGLCRVQREREREKERERERQRESVLIILDGGLAEDKLVPWTLDSAAETSPDSGRFLLNPASRNGRMEPVNSVGGLGIRSWGLLFFLDTTGHLQSTVCRLQSSESNRCLRCHNTTPAFNRRIIMRLEIV